MSHANSDTSKIRRSGPTAEKPQSVDSLVRDSERRNGGYDKPAVHKREEIPSQKKAPRGPKTGV